MCCVLMLRLTFLLCTRSLFLIFTGLWQWDHSYFRRCRILVIGVRCRTLASSSSITFAVPSNLYIYVPIIPVIALASEIYDLRLQTRRETESYCGFGLALRYITSLKYTSFRVKLTRPAHSITPTGPPKFFWE